MLTEQQAVEVVEVKKSKKKWLVLTVLFVVVLAIVGAYEFQYSDDMKEHIAQVNHDMDYARFSSLYSGGLIGSLQTMTKETEIAREIMETDEHVHTLKDQLLASRIKKAAGDGVTVGGAIQSVIAQWNREEF